MLLILLLIVSSACRTTGQVNKEPQATGHKYSKIEQFYTPVENGTPIAAKRKPYSERQFDNNGNLTEFIFRPYETFEKSVNTYKYENNRRVEQMDDGIRTLCTYNNNGDTLEVKQYGHKQYGGENTVTQRSVYTYGSNRKKAMETIYERITDKVIHKNIYTYNNLNLVVRHQYISLLPEVRVDYTAIYTYNSRGNVTKVEVDMPGMDLTAESNYVYNDKGWIMESTTKYNRNPDPVRHIYSYNADGLIVKEHYFWLGKEAYIDYVYTTR
jgi:hypothetical protein